MRVQVIGDLFHGRLPQRPGIAVSYIGRAAPGLPASRYANRHRVGLCRVCRCEHDQVDAVIAYAVDLAERPELIAQARRDLSGDLACWCPESPCDGDVLIAVLAGIEAHQLANRPAILALPTSGATPAATCEKEATAP